MTFHIVDFSDALYGFVTFDFIMLLLIVKIFTFFTTDYNDFFSIYHICVDLRLPKI